MKFTMSFLDSPIQLAPTSLMNLIKQPFGSIKDNEKIRIEKVLSYMKCDPTDTCLVFSLIPLYGDLMRKFRKDVNTLLETRNNLIVIMKKAD